MKIIDFERKGNTVRFYLGADDCDDYGGDDWNDAPYEHNAELVNPEYIKGHRDIHFDFDSLVLEPCCGHNNSVWCKDDMKARRVPCILVVPPSETCWSDNFDYYLGNGNVRKFYFGDKMEPGNELEKS